MGDWGRKYPAIAPSWRRQWVEVVPFFAFPDEVRRIVYATNAIEGLNAKIADLQRARDALRRLARECGEGSTGPCPILTSFDV